MGSKNSTRRRPSPVACEPRCCQSATVGGQSRTLPVGTPTVVSPDTARIGRAPCDVLHAWLGGLTTPGGEGAGKPFHVLPWQSEFLARVLDPDVSTAALSVGRGAGKTTLLAGLAAAYVAGPLRRRFADCVLVASSFEQSRIAFRSVLALLGPLDRKRWRIVDCSNKAQLEDRDTGARVIAIGSDPRRAHGLNPALALLDEGAQWPDSTGPAMVAALETALGKTPGAKLVAIGTRPADGAHWFARLLAGGADFAVTYAADPDCEIDDPAAWRAANPSLPYFPALEVETERAAERAKGDPSMLAAFRALRLNQGTSDTDVAELLSAETWAGCEGDALRRGPVHVGLDLGGSTSMTAAACYWPASGRLECFAAFPAEPDLARRGLQDGVGRLYLDAAAEGCLRTFPGRVTPVAPFLEALTARLAGEHVASVSCDRFRAAELADAMREAGVRWRVRHRGQGWKDGAEDVRGFQRAAVDGRILAVPNRILRWSIAEARTVYDPAGNPKIDRRRARSRIDAAQAAVLAVSAGVAEASRPAPRYVPGVAGGAGR